MTITTRDGLINALANNSSRLVIDKASIANAAGQFHSLWRATGQPGQAASSATWPRHRRRTWTFPPTSAPSGLVAAGVLAAVTKDALMALVDRPQSWAEANDIEVTARSVALARGAK